MEQGTRLDSSGPGHGSESGELSGGVGVLDEVSASLDHQLSCSKVDWVRISLAPIFTPVGRDQRRDATRYLRDESAGLEITLIASDFCTNTVYHSRILQKDVLPKHRLQPAGVPQSPFREQMCCNPTDAPAVQGPYSRLGDLLFCSGSIALDPATSEVVPGGIEPQTEQALKNMKTILEEGGSELGKVVKTTVFLKSMEDLVW
ncbi:Endoribonuclease L-PSP/chorismate mutase-like protein [Mycena vulgaris]|nr:Endoribonuclease L-PSP/chorismate mutase-like protein [Mycena vulgaris]KAJ6534530.1 Endoribonuclease L-PSP/chorismate mutase-like protein [Mycena vulgaris]